MRVVISCVVVICDTQNKFGIAKNLKNKVLELFGVAKNLSHTWHIALGSLFYYAGKKDFFQAFHKTLRIFFFRRHVARERELVVFARCASRSINNADDKNEECMEIEVLYTSTGRWRWRGRRSPCVDFSWMREKVEDAPGSVSLSKHTMVSR